MAAAQALATAMAVMSVVLAAFMKFSAVHASGSALTGGFAKNIGSVVAGAGVLKLVKNGNDVSGDDDKNTLVFSMLGNFHHLAKRDEFAITIQDYVIHARNIHLIANVDRDVNDTETDTNLLLPKGTKLIGLPEIKEDHIEILWHHVHRPEEGVFDKEAWLHEVISVPNLLDNDAVNAEAHGEPVYLQSNVSCEKMRMQLMQ